MRRFSMLLLFVSMLFVLSDKINAQSYLNAVGNPSFGVNIPVPNGYINIANGNLHLEIPLSDIKQRGALNLDEKLVYDSRIWEIVQYTNAYWWPLNIPNSQAGWRFVKGNEPGTIGTTAAGQNTSCWNGTYNEPYYMYTSYYNWTDPTGTVHPFAASSTYYTVPRDCTTQTPGTYTSANSGWATDASGYFATVTAGANGSATVTIKDKTGNQVYPQVIDRFGNYWSSDSNGNLIDDRGQTPVLVTQNGNTTYYDVLAPNGPISNNGTRVRYTVTSEQLTLNTQFNQPPSYSVTEYQGNSGGNPPTVAAVQSIGLPDGSSYQFTYDSYGEIQNMTLPTGGVIQYGWSNYLDSYKLVNRWLTSSMINGYTTNYTPSVITSCQSTGVGCKESVNVHRPSGDEMVYTLTLDNGAWDTNTTSYQGAASSNIALLQTVNQFDFSQPCTTPGCNGAQNVTKQYETDTLADVGLSTQIQTAYSQPQTGQLTTWAQWDYGVSTNNLPTRQINYGYTGFDLTSEAHLDATGNTASSTTYNYTSSATYTGVGYHGSANGGGPYLTSVVTANNAPVGNLTTYYTYDNAGSLLTSQDPKMNTPTTYAYDPTEAFLTEVTRPSTTTFGVTYNHVSKASFDPGSGAILSTDDENSVANGQAFQTKYVYEPVAGRLQSVTYPKAVPTDPVGASQTYSYPTENEVDIAVAQTQTVNVTESIVVDGYARPSQTTSNSISSTQTYDANGRPYTVTTPTSGAASTNGTTYIYYDSLGHVSSVQNPDGTSQTVKVTGNTVLSTDELLNQRKQVFNAFGELTSVLEPDPSSGALVLETDYTRDGLGNVICAEQHGNVSGTGCSSSYTSDPTSPWRVRRFFYNSVSQLVAASVPEHMYLPSYPQQLDCGVGGRWTDCYVYDPNGNLSSITDNRNATRVYSYDALDRPTYRTGADNKIQDMSYDSGLNAVGYLSHESNDVNAASTYTYDTLGKLISESSCRPSNCSTTYMTTSAAYDLAGNRTSITYPDGRVIGNTYDILNRLSNVTYQQWGAVSVGTTYWSASSYAPPGLLLSASYGNGVQMQTQFNSRLSPTSLSYQSTTGSSVQTYFSKSYQWDKNAANLVSETNQINSQQRQFGYDKLNRLTSAFDISSTGTQSTGMATVSGIDGSEQFCPGGGTNTQSQTAKSSAQPQALPPKCSTQWDSGNLSLTVNGFAVSTPYSHFSNATSLATGLTNLLNASGSPVTATNSGGVITMTSVAGGTAANYALSWSTDQDFSIALSGSNMAGGQNGSPTPGSLNQQYTYDAWGNLSSMGGSGFNQGPANKQNQLANIAYDASGRLSNLAGTSYTYDDDGMLLSSSDGNSYLNDAIDARAQATRNGASTEYYYFAGQLIATLSPSSSAWTDFIYAGGQKIAVVQGTQSALPIYTLPDHLGSEIASVDNTSNTVSALDYTPFGQLLSGTASDTFIFTGLEREGSASYGLDHAGFRQYSSATGTWTTPDPFDGSYDEGNPQSLNRYSYTLNSPLTFIDPTGLWPCGGAMVAGTQNGGISLSTIFSCIGSAASNLFGGEASQGLADAEQIALGALGSAADSGFGLALNQPNKFKNKFVNELKTGKAQRSTGNFQARVNSAITSDAMYSFVNFDAGYSDAFTFGGTKWLNHRLGNDTQINHNSNVYRAGAVTGAAVGIYVAGAPNGGKLFGTRFGGNIPLLNSNKYLRVGWSLYKGNTWTFRIGGAWVAKYLSNPHINLYPPSFWGGPPLP